MKKIYNIPKVSVIDIDMNSIICLSGGENGNYTGGKSDTTADPGSNPDAAGYRSGLWD